jgi:transposase
VYTDMRWWEQIRQRVLREGVSQREVLRETGLHWLTLKKVLEHPEPPGYRRAKPRPEPKIGPYVGWIEAMLDADRAMPKKQRHTAQRIFERLREEGYPGGYTQVRLKVRELKQRRQEVFVPLQHDPGEAQMDVGQALVKQEGKLRTSFFFGLALPWSDAFYVQTFERACTETFWEFHCRAFEFFGGVPRRITYDNDKVLVAKILGPHARQLTHGFLQLKSHYLFDTHFCGVRRANEKGVVEATIQYVRRRCFVPAPEVRDLESLNQQLAEACRQDLSRKRWGRPSTKAALLAEDQAAFWALPPVPFDACRKTGTRVSSLSLVRFDRNDYSVPVCHAFEEVVVKGYADRVEISRQDESVARHARRWGQGELSLDPIHYLALLERKPRALDHGKPFARWALPEGFTVLRARMEHAQGGEGTREYIRVLLLLEQHSLAAVTRAVEQGLRVNALTRDAIAQFLTPQEEWRQTTFRLDGREHLRRVQVSATQVAAYGELVSGGGS